MSIYKKGIIFIIYAISFKLVIAQAVSPQQIDALPPFKTVSLNGDWLLDNLQAISAVYKTDSDKTIVLSNGLISRSFRIAPYFGCFSFKNLMNSKEMLRAIQPEAAVTLNGKSYNIGGVKGQFEYAYLQKDWLSNFSNDRAAFQFTGFDVKNISPRFAWKAKRWPFNKNTSAPWPPKGKEIIFYFIAPPNSGLNVKVAIHYSLYDNLPLISKWLTIENNGINPIRVNAFKNEILSFVEEESVVGGKQNTLATPHIKVESDYAFNDMSSTYSDQTTNWLADPSYTSQVNYNRQTPCLLVSEPPIGPYYKIAPHQSFEGYHSFELLYDSYDKERCGLAERKMYRTIAPWITENPIFLHLTTSNPAKVKEAINQCAATGFEMVILSFGSGLNMEDTSIANIKKFKQLADYAHSKGIQLGGYSLFSSRSIDVADDVINPKTGKPGDAIFGSAPCLGSTWGIAYLKKLNTFISKTGFDLLEHDGPYPGDICASTTHPGHEGIKDSQWNQWWMSVCFYRGLRARDIYVNAPDWYFLNGTSKTAMGYRESDWSLPRDRQIIIERQNIYDGTWTKTPSMGWTFVPLTQYHGGGSAATIEPLSEHLHDYDAHLMQNFGSGVQACYRGPRLFDTPATEALVKKDVNWYKKYRDILNSDIIHLRRADGKDWDGILHVNPKLKEKGFVMLYNPLNKDITRTIKLPLYYTGLSKTASIRIENGPAKTYRLNRDYSVEIKVTIAAQGYSWLVIQ